MNDTLLCITCCHDPVSGSAKARSTLSGADAAEWLEKAVDHYRDRYNLPVAVAISAFPGLALVSGGRERDAFYRVFNKTKFLHTHQNPSHQLGAALTMKMGMEYAAASGYAYLVQTAEDIIPRPGSLEAKIRAIREYDFVGGIGELDLNAMPPDQHRWVQQDGPRKVGAGCQVFACRVEKFAFSWDAGQVHDCIEIHMGNFITRPGMRALCLPEEYDHTHNYGEWLKYEERYRGSKGSI